MSLLFGRSQRALGYPDDTVPPRPGGARRTPSITNESSRRHSAVWACRRLRANLISTMPVDAYRRSAGMQVEVPKPPVLVAPGGDRVDVTEWLYSSQDDLDSAGNTFGIVVERDGRGLPARIDLAPVEEVSVVVRQGVLDHYRIGGVVYPPGQVWHERQYTKSGLAVGLSPVAYAAWSIGEYMSIQDFALDWFGNQATPGAHVRNTKQTLTGEQATEVKARFKASVAAGEPWVTGSDWEYTPFTSQAASSSWLEAKQYGVVDIARFFDVPGDLIDAMVKGSSVTYANITQRNLQLLIMHLGPAIVRRERALSRLLPAPRYVKLNTDAILRMDPATRQQVIGARIASRTLAPSEARELDDLPPFTEEQLAEFDRVFGAPRVQPTSATSGVSDG